MKLKQKKDMFSTPSPQPSPPPLFSSPLSTTTSSSTTTSKFLIIILIIIAFAVISSFSFNLLRHLISRHQSSPPPPPPPSFCPHIEHSASSSPPSDQNHIFSLPSPSPVLHKSPDCAVCLSPFRPCDDLRLLPSCRHAFHLRCIDLWLQSTPSCPLCRSPVEEPAASSSFQVEIDLPYSLGHSVEHLAGRNDIVKEENGEEEGQGWLREYLDRMASSASTSFNSIAFSGRLSSHRFDSGSLESVAGGDGRSWEMEGVDWVEESGLAGIYRWFVGM